ncbi:carboxymuconolactone decarboxylase family protein [Cupriavidus sp. 2SB]|uniref:carboxymuconolactone decarboxylase family protein n=1 Tax=Cupriavidus sp. 2SB TaxID=2502199 RepID=UPI0010F4D491|nr:carboxymuconolactone decarboxylase family protein [Cupriavidus sp. 2SB]
MTRMTTNAVASASGATLEMFAGIKRAVGKVPNAYASIGSQSPMVLQAVLQTNGALKSNSSLSAKELEAINLSISQNSACDYCLAAHTLTAKMAGYSVEQTRKLRSGHYDEDPKIDALVKFVLSLVRTSGTVPLAELETVRSAGFSDTQVTDAILAVSAILFTNMFNRVNDTTLDFPAVD